MMGTLSPTTTQTTVLFDGIPHTGTPTEVVAALAGSDRFNPGVNPEAWMSHVAKRITWVTVDTSTPYAFLAGLERAGLIKIIEVKPAEVDDEKV